jgi:hypothetical protein
MKIIYNKNDKVPDQPIEEKETRFSRLINQLDLKDQGLDPEKRKRKWMVILAGIFVLYLLSFLVPSPKLLHHSLNAENKPIANDSVSKGNTSNAQKSLTFEMPVDSFENILKKNIDEKLSKKK